MSEMINIDGVAISKETIVNALKKAGVSLNKKLEPYETYKIIVGYQKYRNNMCSFTSCQVNFPFAIGLTNRSKFEDVEILGASGAKKDYLARAFNSAQIKDIIKALQNLIKT